MSNSTLNSLISSTNHRRGLVVIVDPERTDLWLEGDRLRRVAKQEEHVTALMLGGSTGVSSELMKEYIHRFVNEGFPKERIGLFPSHHDTFCEAGFTLLPVMLNSSNTYYLFGGLVQAMPLIRSQKLDVVSMAYLLIEPADKMTVGKVTKPMIIHRENHDLLENYAQAAEYLKFDSLTLEAGSGAPQTVPPKLVEITKKHFSGLVMVAGGITSTEQVREYVQSGVDGIAIGYVIEQSSQPEQLIERFSDIIQQKP